MKDNELREVLSRFGRTYSPDHQEVVELLDKLNTGVEPGLALVSTCMQNPPQELIDELNRIQGADELFNDLLGDGTGTGASLPPPLPDADRLVREANARAESAERIVRETNDRAKLVERDASYTTSHLEGIAREANARAEEAERKVKEARAQLKEVTGNKEGASPLIVVISILLLLILGAVGWLIMRAPSATDQKAVLMAAGSVNEVNFGLMAERVKRTYETVAVTLTMQVWKKDAKGNNTKEVETIPVPSLGDVARASMLPDSETQLLVAQNGARRALSDFDLEAKLAALDAGLRRANGFIAPKRKAGGVQDRVVRLSDYEEGGALAQPPAEEEDSAGAVPAVEPPADITITPPTDPAPPAEGGVPVDGTPGSGASVEGAPCLRMGVGAIIPDGPCVSGVVQP